MGDTSLDWGGGKGKSKGKGRADDDDDGGLMKRTATFTKKAFGKGKEKVRAGARAPGARA